MSSRHTTSPTLNEMSAMDATPLAGEGYAPGVVRQSGTEPRQSGTRPCSGMRQRFLGFGVTIVVGLSALGGCDSGCPPQLVNDAVKFVDAHQSCLTDDDCVLVWNQCGEL